MEIVGLILTLNEEIHIKRSISSLHKIGICNVVIVDSGSSDKTTDYALSLGCDVVVNSFSTYCGQVDVGLKYIRDNFAEGSYILRLDADEYILGELPKVWSFDGAFIRRNICFEGKLLVHGNQRDNFVLRLWRLDIGQCSGRKMDEKILVDKPIYLQCLRIIDDNRHGLVRWKIKHRKYAKYESESLALNNRRQMAYYMLPIFIRPFLLATYNLFVLNGIKDGKSGLKWVFYQTIWYRLQVDLMIMKSLWRRGI